jgi:CubicO group peptidase (beta-lactamase class C family)
MREILPAVYLIFLFTCSCGPALSQKSGVRTESKNLENFSAFEAKVESLRLKHHIPSLSVGIVHKKKLVYYGGFGFADVENRVAPDRHTIYHLASVSKTFAAIVIMKLVEDGKLSLDDPITKYHIPLYGRWGGDDRIKLKHLLTHTAQGNSFNGFKPGHSFRYNGDFFGQTISAIEQSSGRSYSEMLNELIIVPINLKHTAPNPLDTASFRVSNASEHIIRKRMAKGYDWQNNELVPVEYPSHFGPAAGLVSSVDDLVKYSNAIDEGRFIQTESWNKMFTPTLSKKGKTLPYGIGWFVRNYNGRKVLWHTGWWTGNSSLLVKIPEEDLTLIILANSQDLSRPFYPKINPFRSKLNKDLMKSDFASAFFDDVVNPR